MLGASRPASASRAPRRWAAVARQFRRQDGGAARGARDRDDRAARWDAARDAGRALRGPARALPVRVCAHASRTCTRLFLSLERIAVSVSRETTFPTDIADRAEQTAVLRRLTDRLCEGLARHDRRRAHDRHQGAPRRLHDRHPRPHHRGAEAQRPGRGGGRRLRAARRVRAAPAGAAARGARGGVRGAASRRQRRGPAPAQPLSVSARHGASAMGRVRPARRKSQADPAKSAAKNPFNPRSSETELIACLGASPAISAITATSD